ncbi:RagB/SusD family nutrient uptake outer membrane protein [Edaphocola aurantiacus]|uniref:RagB/SusD family nutrient uptake outer membrane protein n=1 Tax=Edaphocola aurantiacus TaxID=2601682 RepID=UPI001C98C84B|nr:RagB/SusD family nutrient uptake outer membrane protein [Edaphocola aurantiacus]
MNRNLTFYTFVLFLWLLTGCKQDWLDVKPDKGLSVPQTLSDFQSILDDENVLNRQYTFVANAGTDNVFVADADAGNLSESDLNQYTWSLKINWLNGSANEWNHPFTVINSANIVLDGIDKFPSNDQTALYLKGQSLFYRAYAYYTLAQVFCKPYSKATASNDPGLPIRTNTNTNETKQRSSLQEVYNLILNDLKEASKLLPETKPILTRTTAVAAHALLARVYLTTGNYANAKLQCDAVLSKQATLIDYNDNQIVSPSRTFRFPANGIGNPEIIFYGYSIGGNFRGSTKGSVVQASRQLYNLYEDNDLRKELCYALTGDRLNFVASYTGTSATFGGIATNEIYLIRAECLIRTGNVAAALKDLNLLLLNRYKKGTAPTITQNDPKKLLLTIIDERRKELARYTNSRWEDLRRFNLEPEFAVEQKITLKGQTYILAPNSPRYVLNIPDLEIRISGIDQNLR